MSGTYPPVAILIPARNEAAVISGTLLALAEQDYAGPMHIIVCVNGDSDRTAAVVDTHRKTWTAPRSLRVIEISQGSKPLSLNAADRLVEIDCHRIYLDADAALSPTTVTALITALSRNEPRVAAPRRSLRSGGNWLVLLIAHAWLRLPWVQDDIVGSGVLAVNASGRRRWGEFPDVIADDAFAAWQFAPADRIIVEGCTSAICLPSQLWALLRVLRRWIDGNRQLAASTHRPPFGPAWSYRRRIWAMLSNPSILLAAMVTRIARLLAVLLIAPTETATWNTPR